MAAISEIVESASWCRSARWVAASCALGAVLLLTSEASAARVSLLGFEGDRATPIRWRVAQILKRAGHTVLGFAPPRNPDSASELRAYAGRRRVDTFVAGSAVENDDGWELSLTLRDADGETFGKPLTFTAPTLGALVKELKSEGQGRLDRAVRGGGSGSGSSEASDDNDASADREASDDIDVEEEPALDLASNMRSRVKAAPKAKKKKAKKTKAKPQVFKKSRPVEVVLDEDPEPEEAPVRKKAPAREEEPLSLDEPSEPEEEAPRADAEEARPATEAAEASGWSTSDSSPFDEEGGASSSDDSGASDEVGVDESTDGEDGTTGAADPTVVVGVNAGLVRRTLVYTDDLYGRLRAPSANSWVYQLNAAVYPFARPVKNRIGLIASYESVMAGVVRDNTAGTDFAVTHSELFGGVRLRQPLGKHELALEAEIGTLAAGLDDPEGVSAVPEFDYTLLRSSLGVGLNFGPVSARGALGYRLSIGDYGQVSSADYFPRMEGYGVEGSLGLQYQFSKEVAFGVSGSMRRFVLTMNSEPQDAIEGVAEVAAGAVDMYLSGYFGLNITL